MRKELKNWKKERGEKINKIYWKEVKNCRKECYSSKYFPKIFETKSIFKKKNMKLMKKWN